MPRARPSAPIIRTAGRADLDAVHRIERLSFDADRFSRATLQRLLKSPSAAFLVADAGGDAVGYAVILFRAGSEVARLYSLAVDPARRGLGLARGLLAAAEAASLARGARVLRLEVRASNTAGLRLYERAGFTFLERRPGYYSDGEDAVRLEKRLRP
jgi:ribosomal-protein-alanine acetyltransferase